MDKTLFRRLLHRFLPDGKLDEETDQIINFANSIGRAADAQYRIAPTFKDVKEISYSLINRTGWLGEALNELLNRIAITDSTYIDYFNLSLSLFIKAQEEGYLTLKSNEIPTESIDRFLPRYSATINVTFVIISVYPILFSKNGWEIDDLLNLMDQYIEPMLRIATDSRSEQEFSLLTWLTAQTNNLPFSEVKKGLKSYSLLPVFRNFILKNRPVRERERIFWSDALAVAFEIITPQDDILISVLSKTTLESVSELSRSYYDISFLLRDPAYRDQVRDYLRQEQLEDGSWGSIGVVNCTERIVNTLAVLGNAKISYNRDLNQPWLQKALVYVNSQLSQWNQTHRVLIGSGLIIDYFCKILEGSGLTNFNSEAITLAGKKLESINKDGIISHPSTYYLEVTKFVCLPEMFDDRSLAIVSPAACISLVTGGNGTSSVKSIVNNLITKYGIRLPTFTSLDVFVAIWAARYLKFIGINYKPVDFPNPSMFIWSKETAKTPVCHFGMSSWSQVADADDSVVYYLAMASNDEIQQNLWKSIDPFWSESGGYFLAYPNERAISPTVVAHCLEALRLCPPTDENLRRQRRSEEYLIRDQTQTGYWLDKWHISPYYATCEIIIAMLPSKNLEAQQANQRAIQWIKGNQKENGSFGCLEETALALIALIKYSDSESFSSILRGWEYIKSNLFGLEEELNRYPLWISKNLYSPKHIIRSIVVAAYTLAERYLIAI